MLDLETLARQCHQAKMLPHGHVNPTNYGGLAECGGPALCRHCLLEWLKPYIDRMLNDGSTHAADCWSWGTRHYDCAVAEIERLRKIEDAAVFLLDDRSVVADERGPIAEPSELQGLIDALTANPRPI